MTESGEQKAAGCCLFVFVVFVLLKLVGVTEWSWWRVACPLWIPIGWYGFCLAMFVVFDRE